MDVPSLYRVLKKVSFTYDSFVRIVVVVARAVVASVVTLSSFEA